MAEHGYIRIIFADHLHNEYISLGQARFQTPQALDQVWAQLPPGAEDSDFLAERLNADLAVVDDKTVNAAAVAARFGRPIQQVIARARRQHARLKRQCHAPLPVRQV